MFFKFQILFVNFDNVSITRISFCGLLDIRDAYFIDDSNVYRLQLKYIQNLLYQLISWASAVENVQTTTPTRVRLNCSTRETS